MSAKKRWRWRLRDRKKPRECGPEITRKESVSRSKLVKQEK